MFRRFMIFMVSRGWFDNWLNQWSLRCQISWLVSDAMPIWSWNPQKIHREFHGKSTGGRSTPAPLVRSQGVGVEGELFLRAHRRAEAK